MASDKLYLASQSPRRRELAAILFNDIQVLMTQVEEPAWQRPQRPQEYLTKCVNIKWEAAKRGHKHSTAGVLLVADTIVVLGQEVFGKPTSKAHAAAILQRLSGRVHSVFTGYCLGWGEKSSGLRVVETKLQFKQLTATEIKKYIQTGDPMDKAGAYGFQGLALQFVEWIEGSYTNVMGLPVEDLRVTWRELTGKAK